MILFRTFHPGRGASLESQSGRGPAHRTPLARRRDQSQLRCPEPNDGTFRASEANGYSGRPSVFRRVVERLLNDSVERGFNRGRQTLALEPLNGDPQFGSLGHTLRQEFEGWLQAQITQNRGPEFVGEARPLLGAAEGLLHCLCRSRSLYSRAHRRTPDSSPRRVSNATSHSNDPPARSRNLRHGAPVRRGRRISRRTPNARHPRQRQPINEKKPLRVCIEEVVLWFLQ